MLLKKILLPLCLVCSSLAYSDAKQTSEATPPSTEQATPAAEPEAAAPNAPQEEGQGPAPLPSSQEMTTSYESAFVRMLVTLLGLVALVFATFWILRKLGKGKFKMGSERNINIVEKRPLSPKTMLYIVEIGHKKVLISESQLEVRSLSSIEEVPEIDE